MDYIDCLSSGDPWADQFDWIGRGEAFSVWKPLSDKMSKYSHPNNWRYCLDQPASRNGVVFTPVEVPIFLKDIISPEELSRLSKSVLQIRVNPRSTLLQLSPRYGVMTLKKVINIFNYLNARSQYATAAIYGQDADHNEALQERFSYPFKYNYEHLKNWRYKERDVYNLTNKDDNQQNDLAFTTFPKVLALDWQPSDSDVQDFFVPTSKTWSLHKTDVFIFAYSSESTSQDPFWLKRLSKDPDSFYRIFPEDKKVMKQGKVLFRRPKDDRIQHTMPPIVGIHSCGAYDGMEGGAIVSIKCPGELIGIHVSGVDYSNDPKDTRFNLFVSVHHPRFVKFYAEKIIYDLQTRAKPFLVRNLEKIRAYLTLHGYSIDVDLMGDGAWKIRVTDPNKQVVERIDDDNLSEHWNHPAEKALRDEILKAFEELERPKKKRRKIVHTSNVNNNETHCYK